MLSREQLESALGGLRAYVNPTEIPLMYDMASHVPDNGVIVEIGTGNGASALIWLDATRGRNVQVYTVDSFEGCSTGKFNPDMNRTHEALVKALETLWPDSPFDFLFRFTELIGKSVQMAELWSKKQRRAIHLLYVDGDHTYGGCRADVDAWSPFMPCGSVLMLHDANRPGDSEKDPDEFDLGYPGPSQVMRELRKAGWANVGRRFSLVALKKVNYASD
jgi:hypothetical protein